jgi:AraC-like DNA-binding protein/ligand-binding sensor protein
MQEINEILGKEIYDHAETLQYLLKGIIKKYDVKINLTDIAGISKIDNQLDDIFNHYSYHNNSFCNYVKKNATTFCLCVKSKDILIKALSKKNTPFYGTCYMGINELYYPVWYNEQPIALICIGQFSDNIASSTDYVHCKAQRYGLDPEACIEEYAKITKTIHFSASELNKDVWVICNFMSMLYRNRILQESISYEQSKAIRSTADYYQSKYIVSSAAKFIKQNYASNISLDLIAKHSYCNSTYLSHIFKKETGTTITDYINNCRVSHAKHLLDVTDMTITQISSEVGFNDSSYFSRTFNKIQGMYPSHYRKRSTPKENTLLTK